MILRTLSIVHKEFLHIIRDRRSLMVIFAMPIVQLLLMGFSTANSIEHLRTAVIDGDRSQASRELIEAYTTSNYFTVIAYVDNLDDLIAMIDSGQARAGLAIPAGYSHDLDKGHQPDVAMYIDGSDTNIANTAFVSSQAIGQAKAINFVTKKIPGAAAKLSSLEVRPRVLYNPNMESSYFMLPGLLGTILFNLTLISTVLSIVREKEQGTIEQLIVTPIRPIELVAGKLIPYIFIGFLNLIEILVISDLLFKVPINGSLFLLLGLAILFIVPSLGLGVFISTISSTQREAMMSSMMILLPSIFLSGLFFPIETMPSWLQALSLILPLRYSLVISRGIILKGIGLPFLINEVIALCLLSTGLMVIAALRFRKRLE